MEQIKIFVKYRFLLYNLIGRDLKVKYRRSTIGILWSVLNPLMMMGIQYVVFSYMFRQDVPNFAVYLAAGNLVFQSFSDSTQSAMSSILGAATLIKKVYIPKYIFPTEKVMFGFVNTMFSSIAMIVVIIVTQMPVTINILFAPFILVLLMLFNLGVGLVLSAVVVFFRDIMHLYSVLVMGLTYLTPIFYTEDLLATQAPFVIKFLQINPLYWFVAMFREVVLYGRPPQGLQVLICTSWAIVMLAFGLFVFRKTQDKFILYI